MSKRINKIRLSSWLYSGRKGSGASAGRDEEDGVSWSERAERAGEEKS